MNILPLFFSNISEENINNGDYLLISSNQDVTNNILKASSIEGTNNNLEANTHYEIEGFVTNFNSISSFTIDDENSVITNNDTVFTNGSVNNLKLGQLLIVIGTTNSERVLISEEIRLDSSSNSIAIEANIESIDLSNGSLVVLGKTINIDNFTLLSDETTEDFSLIDLSEFAVGDSVFVDAFIGDGEFIANRLSKIPNITSESIIGVIDTLNSAQSQFSIANSTISTDTATEYLDEDQNTITATTFFFFVRSRCY